MTMSAVLTSIHGRYVGQDRNGALLAHKGVIARDFTHDLNAATTSANIGNGGVSTIPGTAAAVITMDAPATGIEKIIALTSTSTSTAARTVALASGTFMSTAASTYNTLTFNGMGQTIRLIGLSTARFAVVANAGVALS